MHQKASGGALRGLSRDLANDAASERSRGFETRSVAEKTSEDALAFTVDEGSSGEIDEDRPPAEVGVPGLPRALQLASPVTDKTAFEFKGQYIGSVLNRDFQHRLPGSARERH